MDKLPIETGIYTLFLRLLDPCVVRVGRLGHFKMPAGKYACKGSARGQGGLRARLGRHLRGNGKTHWHIDYLRAKSEVLGYAYFKAEETGTGDFPAECAWNQALLDLNVASLPVPGFGTSDCMSGCGAHLVYVSAGKLFDDPLRGRIYAVLKSVIIELYQPSRANLDSLDHCSMLILYQDCLD